MRYLFSGWQRFKETLRDKHLFLLLDYDGTLAPIAATPQKAVLPEGTKELLRKLAERPGFKIAVISGRSLKDIKNKFGLKGIIYVGNHGLEVEGPKIKYKIPVSPRSKEVLGRIKNSLAQRLSGIKGAILEDKGLSLALHYRLAARKDIARLKAIFHEAVILYLVRNKVKLGSGKKVLEVKLPMEWDKGKTALWLLARENFFLRERKILPIYFGDDKTDEDAFKALRNKGPTVFVGRPRNSYAEFYLKDYKEVEEFLRRLCRD